MKRRSYVRHDAEVPLGIKPLVVWGYGRTGKLVCRVDINRAGMAIWRGAKSNQRLADWSWEKLVDQLSNRRRNVKTR